MSSALPSSPATRIRLADGKIVEVWVNYDLLGLLQQLGVIPAMA